MRTVSVRLADLERVSIPIGFVGENQHTQVRIDCLKLYEEYPTAAASLTVKPPKGDSYPAVVVRDGNTVVWEIVGSDLIYQGNGEIQLSFTVDEEVAKSFIGRTKINRSITPTGEVPDPIDDFLTRAGAALTAIPETIDEALAEAKASGEFDGTDGVSPTVTVLTITGGHRVVITDAEQTKTVDILDGTDGQDGTDGHTPVITATKSGSVTTIYVDGVQIAQISDGEDGDPGTPGHSPVLTSSKSGKTTTIYSDGTQLAQILDGEDGQSGASAIDDTSTALDKVWSASKVNSEVSTLQSAINSKIDEPQTEGTSGQVLTTDGNGGRSWTTPSGGGGVSDVQVNGTSVVSSGVANVPVASDSALGTVKVDSSQGVVLNNSNTLILATTVDATFKTGTSNTRAVVPSKQHVATFYGLAKAAGSDEKNSTKSLGIYTEDAKSAISEMLNAPETISGSTPSITGKAGVRYICGECSTLTIVVPSSGIIDVLFESGSTATVLTVTPTKTGVTAIKWANGFDPTSLDANTTYEVNILDGEFGVVGKWT